MSRDIHDRFQIAVLPKIETTRDFLNRGTIGVRFLCFMRCPWNNSIDHSLGICRPGYISGLLGYSQKKRKHSAGYDIEFESSFQNHFFC